MWRQWDESVTSPSPVMSVPRLRVERVHPGARQAGPVAESRAPDPTVRLGRRVPWAGWCFTYLTLLPVLLALAWLIPGTALLMAGRLRPAPALLISAPLAVILIAAALRRVPGQRLLPAPGVSPPRSVHHGSVHATGSAHHGPAHHGPAGPGRARVDRLVGPGGHDSRRGRVRGVAAAAEFAADHRAAPAGRGVPARLLDRGPRIAAHPGVAARLRRRAPRARVRQHRAGRHAWRPGPAVPARAGRGGGRRLVDSRHVHRRTGQPGARRPGRAHLRRPGRAARGAPVGAPGGPGPRGRPPGAVREPVGVHPAAGPAAAARGPVPGG